MSKDNKKGTILFIVIGIIMVVSVLAAAMLRLISDQSRLTHHQVSRIQAQYAARAAIIYAYDKLFRNDDGTWPSTGQITKRMCRSGCDINEFDLPNSIQRVDITVLDVGSGPNNTRKISANAIYTFPPS